MAVIEVPERKVSNTPVGKFKKRLLEWVRDIPEELSISPSELFTYAVAIYKTYRTDRKFGDSKLQKLPPACIQAVTLWAVATALSTTVAVLWKF